jgi:hypothetical protein
MKELGWESVNCINLAQNRHQSQALLIMVINLRGI